MVRKILFFIFLVVSIAGYSQKKITKLTASPNPFVSNTTISFYSESEQNVTFSVRNVIGKTVATKKIKVKKGRNTIPFSRNNLKSGMYLYSIRSEVKVTSKRFVIR
jgi:hypothetical protein